MAGIQLTGLSSGFDWKSVVDQLMAIEQAPITRLQNEQASNEKKSDALGILDTKMAALQTAMTSLNTAGLYTSRSVSSSNTSSNWTLSASAATATGAYKIAVSQLATTSSISGATGIAAPLNTSALLSALPVATTPTSGTFTINGKKITVDATTDSLDAVITRINATSGIGVTARMEASTGAFVLESQDGVTPVVTGAANDTSNFLLAMRIASNTNTVVNSGTGAVGLKSSGTLAAMGLYSTLSTRLAAQPSTSTGSFSINGTSINYDTTESLNTLLARISNSSAGVSASYDSSSDRIVLTNKVTGDLGITVADDNGGNMTTVLGLAGGSTSRGKNAAFTINGGGTLYSSSNTLTSSAHGVTGLQVTIASEGTTETVNVSVDTSTARTKIDEFVSKYNDVQDYIDSQTKITSANGKVTSATLASNREIQEWSRSLRTIAFAASASPSGTLSRLNDLGLDFYTDSGKLEVKDNTKLNTALLTQGADVESFFTSSSTGFVASFDSFFKSTLGTTTAKGSLDTQVERFASTNKSIDNQIADIQRRLVNQRSMLESSFIAMESAQSKSSNILTQLTNSFSSKSS